MRPFLFFVLIPITLFSQSADTVVEGKRYVLYSSYERDDSIMVFEYCESITKSGKANGNYVAYTGSGVLMEEGRFRKGRKVGEWISYFPDGKIEHIGSYKKGHANGNWTWFHPNGVVRGKARYVQTREIKKIKVASIRQTQFWTPKRYYPWFKIEIHTVPVDSVVEYYPDSKLKVRMRFDAHGTYVDSTEYFYPSGQRNCVQYWKDNLGVGCWKYYCTDGTLNRCENNEPHQPDVCACSDEIYIECEYYDVTIGIPWYMGRARVKF